MAKSKAGGIIIALNEIASKESVGLALNIHGRLVEETPKDTGWAASNWVPQAGSRFPGVVGDPDNVDTSRQSSGALSLLNWNINKGPIYISNNVDYIQALNAGHSKQAPAMFVEKIVSSELAKAKSSSRGLMGRLWDKLRSFFS